MKTFKYIICSLFFVLYSYQSLRSQAYNTSSDGYIAPSVSNMSFGKYADIPVDPSTGTTGINIPITSVSDGTLQHSISLSYHSGGIRVSELASSVGLGWNLNAGGVIGRTVRGLPDDDEDGYWNKGNQVNTSQKMKIANGELDGEPDIFFFNVGGMVGKFMIDKNRNVHMIPKSNTKIDIEYSGSDGFTQFKLTSTDGTMYYFGKYSGADYRQTIKVGTRDKYVDTWNLFSIKSFDEKHAITFTYDNSAYKYHTYKECHLTRYSTGGNSQHIYSDCSSNSIEIKVDGFVLKRIFASTKEITFGKAKRYDVFTNTDAYHYPYKNTYIKVKDGSKSYQYNLSQSYFSDGSSAGNNDGQHNLNKRLRLDRVQRISGSTYEPPYVFSYYGPNNGKFFEKLASKKIDHWGYYNAKNNLSADIIPPTTVETTNGTSISYGNAERQTVESEMIKGNLKRVTFPTKGYTELVYEANSYYTTNSTGGGGVPEQLFHIKSCATYCCNQMGTNIIEGIDQQMINTGTMRIKITGYNCTGNNHSAYFTIRDASNGYQTVWSTSLNVNGTAANEIPYQMSSLNLIAGHNYKFEIHSTNAKGEIKVDYTTGSTGGGSGDELVGGLRVQKIRTHDGISSSNDIIRTFEYKRTDNKSSGKLYNQPVYGLAINSNNVIFSSTPVRAMSNAQGMHIIYERVKEYFNGNGYSEYIIDFKPQSSSLKFPAIPGRYSAQTGKLLKKSDFNQSGTLESKIEIEPYQSTYVETLPGYQVAAVRSKLKSTNGQVSYFYPFTSYNDRTELYRPSKTINTLDGVRTQTQYYYSSNRNILPPNKIKTQNSDDDWHEIRLFYSYDYYDYNVRNNLRHRNMIELPYIEYKYVNNQVVDGKRVYYGHFDSNGNRVGSSNDLSKFPRPYYHYRYERTWKNGSLQSGEWKPKTYLAKYNANGLLEKYLQNGWSYTYLFYNSKKLLTKEKYGSHETTYEYSDNSSLVSKKFAVDGRSTSFTYDNLMRLKTKKDDSKNIENRYTYFFTSNLSSQKNYIETEQKFFNTGKSLRSRSYSDGLGREIQTVLRGHGSNGKDVLISTAYDKHGRLKYEYKKREGYYSTGLYVQPSSSWLKTETQYFNSPLNRVYRTKKPGWHWTNYYYGSNDSNDYVKKNGTYANYSVNQLYKTTITDPDGRKTIQLSDKIGQNILTRKSNSNETNKLDTYTLYDDKGRVTHILPPGVPMSATSTKLYYKYEYDGEDNLIEKHIPGADKVLFKYNNKDLLAGYQDGYLKDKGWWYTYTHDSYGRETTQGFYFGTPSSNFNPGDIQIRTTYGSSGIDRDKVKKIESKILGTGTFLTTYNTYNSKGQLTRKQGNSHANLSNGSMNMNYTYDGNDRITESHSTINALGIYKNIRYKQEYDNAFRLKSNLLKVDNDGYHKLNEFHYNIEDEVSKKLQGRTNKSGALSWLQEINYNYLDNGLLNRINTSNLHGGQQSITNCNDPNPPDPGSNYNNKDLFYLELFYDQNINGTNNTIQKNGNISNVAWQVRGRDQGIYSYTYDDFNRLKRADYFDKHGGTVSNSDRFNTEYNYDARGNLTSLKRRGRTNPSSCNSYGQIDNLSFYYHSYSNELRQVVDHSGNPEGFKDGHGSNYKYDSNGNMTHHYDKKLQIDYNHLNLPTVITEMNTSKKIEFTYDAMGGLLKRVTKNGSSLIEERNYLSGIEIVKKSSGGHKLESIHHAEGRIFYNQSSKPRYEYAIQDHLGNTRLSYTDFNGDGKINAPEDIIWEGHYYPYGLMQSGPWMDNPDKESNYKYNGIELLDDFDWGIYNATYRILDPSIARWLQVDPKAEANFGLSPYNSMNNNPISFSDPEGDLAFLAAVAIGAGIGVLTNGVGNAMNNQGFFDGAGQAALVGGIGGALGQFGGGSLLNDIAWGAVEGGITGGIGAELNGGNFGDGFLKGAAIGAGATFAYNLPGAIKNAKGGYGFNTNMGSFDNLAKDAVSGGVVDPIKAQGALDFWADRFGGPKLNFAATGSPSTSVTGTVKITGQKFIDGVGHVKRAIAHETGHWVHNLNWDGGKVGGTISSPKFINLDRSVFGGDGVYGYHTAIKKAGKYHIGYKAISNGRGAFRVAPAWNSFGSSKWWPLIPRRFF